MKVLNKLFSFLKKEKETETDEKLKDIEPFTITPINIKKDNIFDIDAVIFYYNEYNEIIRFAKSDEEKKKMEENLSEISIVIYGTLCKQFLDSLDFFNQINHRNIDGLTEKPIDYLKKFVHISEEGKIYVMVSGSIKDFKGFFKEYCTYFMNSGKDERIIGLLVRELGQAPVTKGQYDELRQLFGFNLKERVYYLDPNKTTLYSDIVNNGKDFGILSVTIPTSEQVDELELETELHNACVHLRKQMITLQSFDVIIYDKNKVMSNNELSRVPYSKLSSMSLYKKDQESTDECYEKCNLIMLYLKELYHIKNDMIAYYNIENELKSSTENNESTDDNSVKDEEFVETLLKSVDEIIT